MHKQSCSKDSTAIVGILCLALRFICMISTYFSVEFESTVHIWKPSYEIEHSLHGVLTLHSRLILSLLFTNTAHSDQTEHCLLNRSSFSSLYIFLALNKCNPLQFPTLGATLHPPVTALYVSLPCNFVSFSTSHESSLCISFIAS